KISQAGMEAVRRKFTPEFVNRLDKIVVFRPLGEAELKQVLEIELRMLQRRIFLSSAQPFVFSLTDAAKEFVLREGVDLKYGARHLKRAVERLLVQPLSNLIATEQIAGGDHICVDLDPAQGRLIFYREVEGIPLSEMAKWYDLPLPLYATAEAGLAVEVGRTSSARSTRRA
ncbi:MAG: ATP-dependent Clp protease ATP-binding subunit, partial [Bryobacteraceae bacterium]